MGATQELRDVPPPGPRRTGGSWAAWVVLVLVGLGGIAFLLAGGTSAFSPQTLIDHHERLRAGVAGHVGLAAVAYVAGYAILVAFSVPGAVLFTVTGGFLFGGALGAVLAMTGATAGATGLFLVARTTLGDILARKAGPRLQKLGEGFRTDAWSYLLALRLLPLFPFWVVNLAAALFRIPLHVFIGATILGILPSTIAISMAGSALASVIHQQALSLEACRAAGRSACAPSLDLTHVVTPELVAALAALAVLALVPAVVRRWRKAKQGGTA